jgi:hypothetical protein
MKVTLVIATLLLAGCVTPDRNAIGPYPSGAGIDLVRDYVRQNFFDPYSMQDVSLSQPQHGHIFMSQGWIVCLEANAKNRMGGYTGLSRTAILIRNEKVISAFDKAPLCNDRSLIYTPWPDLMQRR